jgi:propanol-preferring alcohol dehydrogenase
MILKEICNLNEKKKPLTKQELPQPVPAEHEVLIRVSVCGICHTELDEIEGRTASPNLPVVLDHQVVGTVEHQSLLLVSLIPGIELNITSYIKTRCSTNVS